MRNVAVFERSRASPRQRVFDERKRLVDGVKESADGVRISRAGRIPIDDEGEVDPPTSKEHAAGKGPDMEARDIDIAALGIGAHAQRQGHEINEIAQREDAAEFVERFDVLKEVAPQGARRE